MNPPSADRHSRHPSTSRVIVGIASRAELNGQVCDVLEFDERSHRYTVRLQDGANLRLKGVNLQKPPTNTSDEGKATRSDSESLRTQGNSKFKAASAHTAPVLRKGCLQDAKVLYRKALDAALEHETSAAASAMKNLGICSLESSLLTNITTDEKRTYLIEGFEFLRSAWDRRYSHEPAWTEQLCSLLLQRIQNVTSDRGTSLDVLHPLTQVLPPGCALGTLWLEIGQRLFDASVLVFENESSFLQGLQLINDCHRPVAEAKRWGDNQLISRSTELAERVLLQQCVYESCQARAVAKRMVEQAVMENETLAIDLVWQGIDLYKEAEKLSREKDIESEAISKCSIAAIYRDVLKLKGAAKRYFSEAFALCQALWPKAFHTESWYQDMVQTIQQYQNEAVAEDSHAKDAERAPYLEKLSGTLTGIRAAFDNTKGGSITKGVRYLYENHPPKPAKGSNTTPSTKRECPEMGSDVSLKRVLMLVISHYHPDRHHLSANETQCEADKEWAVLTEQITMMLTNHYERFK